MTLLDGGGGWVVGRGGGKGKVIGQGQGLVWFRMYDASSSETDPQFLRLITVFFSPSLLLIHSPLGWTRMERLALHVKCFRIACHPGMYLVEVTTQVRQSLPISCTGVEWAHSILVHEWCDRVFCY